MVDDTKISKYMAYLLRHDPEGMDMDRRGFVDLSALLSKLCNRWSEMPRQRILDVVKNDPKGRYEIKGGKIRAVYGHSVPVELNLENDFPDELYHGTTEEASASITTDGLKPGGRLKVHLSRTIEEAKKVGKRRSSDPIILKIDAKNASGAGIDIQKASEDIFVSEHIPPDYITKLGHYSELGGPDEL